MFLYFQFCQEKKCVCVFFCPSEWFNQNMRISFWWGTNWNQVKISFVICYKRTKRTSEVDKVEVEEKKKIENLSSDSEQERTKKKKKTKLNE